MKSKPSNNRKKGNRATALVTVLAIAWIFVMTYLWGQPLPGSR